MNDTDFNLITNVSSTDATGTNVSAAVRDDSLNDSNTKSATNNNNDQNNVYIDDLSGMEIAVDQSMNNNIINLNNNNSTSNNNHNNIKLNHMMDTMDGLDTDSTPMNKPYVPTFGLLHTQNRLDVFIIKSYHLLSNGMIINSNLLQSAGNTPQNTMTSPTALLVQPSSLSKTLSIDENINNNNNNTNNEYVDGKLQNDQTPDSMTTLNSNNTILGTNNSNQKIFHRMSILYNAIITNGDTVDEKSNLIKSHLELLQRFIQIIKELELSFELSPYNIYFHHLDDQLWQIKTDSELLNDKLWQDINKLILKVYNPSTGKLINLKKTLNNGKIIRNMENLIMTPMSNVNDTNGTGGKNSNDNDNSTTEKDNIKKPAKKKPQRKRATTTTSTRTTKRNTKKKTNLTNNVGIQEETATNTTNNNSNNNNTNINNSNIDNLLDIDSNFPQLLQKRLSNIHREDTYNNNNNNNNNNNFSRSLNGYYTQPTSPGLNIMNNPDMLNSFDFNNLLVNNNFINSTGNRNNSTTNNTTTNNNVNNSDNAKTELQNLIPTITSQLKETFNKIIQEKDQRLIQLERELHTQKKEVQWLRKMLIEDMGCLRSMVDNIKKSANSSSNNNSGDSNNNEFQGRSG